MKNYQLELRQIVDFPRCRIYREFVQDLLTDRSIRTGGCSGLFYFVVLCSYANFRTSYRRIDGISYTVYPGEWICSITDITEWFRVRFHYQAFAILKSLQDRQLIKVECYPNTPAIKVQLLPVNAGERITMTQNLGQPLPRYQAFLCDGMLEVDSTAFMDYMEENDLGYIVDYKRYDADVFTGVNRRTAAVFQFHSAALRRLNKVGCQRYEGDYTRLKQKHAERRARRMAG